VKTDRERLRSNERKEAMTDVQTRTVVDVYVRLCGAGGGEECREMGFRIPGGVEQADLLQAGFALDGNSASKSVVPFHTQNGNYVPLMEALHEEQQALVLWLGERGHTVRFR
jgi:hypothetical protein